MSCSDISMKMTTLEKSSEVQDTMKCPDTIIESPDSPGIIQDSPDSPDILQESPDSPDEIKDEEVFFIEDRRPGNLSLDDFNLLKNKAQPEVIEDFIKLSSNEAENDATLVGIDSREVDVIENPEVDSMDEKCFFEDRNPQLTGQEVQIPIYKINDDFLEIKKMNPANKRNRKSCWNCGESSHSLRDCTERKDYVQIEKSRKEFQESRANIPVYKRYHVDETQQLGHLVPGQLSEELRQALGLEPQDLPNHIYMMRYLGYPPGWLEEALVTHSGITMYDGLGKEVLAPGVVGGNIVTEDTLDKYDGRKIIQYPGFNVPPLPGTYDDSRYWKCPPMSKLQSLEVMLEKLGDRVVGGYKRRKLSHNATMSSDLNETTESNNSQDMDYEEMAEGIELPPDNCGFIPPLPEEDLPPPPPLDLPPEPSDDLPIEETSLIELEEQKKQLLSELNDVSPLCSTPESRVGKIKSVDLGTPILKSVSKYRKLPSAEKFSVNICDVINFENLPDSTGKYDKMSDIIRNVRSKLSELK